MKKPWCSFSAVLALLAGLFLHLPCGSAQTLTLSPNFFSFDESQASVAVLRLTNQTTQVVTVKVTITGDAQDFSVAQSANGIGCKWTPNMAPDSSPSFSSLPVLNISGLCSLTIMVTSNVLTSPLTATLIEPGIEQDLALQATPLVILNSQSGKALDVIGDSSANGTLLQL